jgi:Ca-activated chloride channel family protein
MTDFHFIRPEWFWALPVVLVFVWLLWRRRLNNRSWQDICDPQLLPHLLLNYSTRRAYWPLWLTLIGLLLAITALAGPTWKKQPQPLLRQQSALVILLDLSRSMNAEDLKPSRLQRAQLKIRDLLQQRREGQTALIAFAGDAFVVTPLTDDTRTIELLLNRLDPEIMPIQGSHVTRALETAAELLHQAGFQKGTLLLVTDEDRPQEAQAMAQKLAQQGITLAVLGVGTQTGAPIPLADGGFFKDSQGNLVLPQLKESDLRQLAIAGHGRYHRLTTDDSDLNDLLETMNSHRLDQNNEESTRLGDQWQNAGFWLLLPLAFLAACVFRRGWLLVFVVLLLPAPAQAFNWNNIWQRPDQQAYTAFKNKEYQDAADHFEDPQWKASALYHAGQYAEALKAQGDPLSADDWYNRGNILARSGQLSEALKAYDEALKLNPNDEDIKTNRQLVEEALKEQQAKQQQSQPKQAQAQEQEQTKAQQPEADSDKQQDKANSEASQQTQKKQSSAADQKKNSSPSFTEQQDLKKNQPANNDKQQEAKQEQATTRTSDENQPAQNSLSELSAGNTEELPKTMEQRELQQLLRRIPDDPGELLRRKFLYQYRQREQQMETDRPW